MADDDLFPDGEPRADGSNPGSLRESDGNDVVSGAGTGRADGAVDPERPVPGRDARLGNVLVGVPAYNEEITIGSLVLAARRLTDSVLVVDDGSTDDTAEIARSAGASVVRHDRNRGKGAAVRTLFEHTIRGEYDALVLLDGDGQHMPEDIPAVVAPILEGDCDVVVGSRYIDGDASQTPLYRRFGQHVLDYATVGVTGTKLSDTQSGFRALSPYAVKKLNISTDGMGVESEMLMEIDKHGFELREIGIDVRYEEVDGQTFNPVRHGVSVLAYIVQSLQNRRPVLFYGLPGIALVVLGCGIGLHSLMLPQSDGGLSQWRVTASELAVTLGALVLFLGVTLQEIRQHHD
jgi:glycosyltransferase involved in cell wall biosynthesis